MASRSAALEAYRALLRAGKAYPDYNVRHYIVRRARDSFREHRGAGAAQAGELLGKAREALALIRRQSTIAGFYAGAEPSVMESYEAAKAAGGRGGAPPRA